jgi:Family of unknown function (DUF5690)
VFALKKRLVQSGPLAFVLTAGVAAFAAYGCVYAFRKPFTAASFTGMTIFGVQYKIALVIAQVAGYALSKFIGIWVISALGPQRRALTLSVMMGIAALSLLGFALSPPGWGVFWMFLNGLPLGMAWGVVFGYLEGRRVTEALAAFLCVNFILSSGFVKTTGRWLMLEHGITEFWMPFAAGMLFLPLLAFCIWVLEHLPPPNEADRAARSERTVMTAATRKALFLKYAPGLLLLSGIYLVLTIVRDVRDNFFVELWQELGFGNQPSIMTTAEIPVALFVLASLAALMFVKNNFRALWLYHDILIAGAVVLAGSTFLFQKGLLSPVPWMIVSGSSIFLPYILFNGVLFDRLLAAFREKANVGFLMYIADAVGYLGSAGVLLWRNFGSAEQSWTAFFTDLCLYGAGITLLLSALSRVYFARRRTQA